MPLLNEYSSEVKSIISRGPSSDDLRTSDREIYQKLKKVRSFILKQQFEKGRVIHPDNYISVCLELEVVENDECECMDSDCYVLRTKDEIPQILSSKKSMFGLIMEPVTTTEGVQLFFTNYHRKLFDQYRKRKDVRNRFGWYIRNKRLYVTSSTLLKYIVINAVWHDPVTLATLACSGEGNACYDPLLEDFPLDPDLIKPVIDMVVEELLNVKYSLPQDLSNNAKEELKEKNT